MARNQISSIAFGQVNSAVRILPGASVNVASQSGAAVTLYQTEDGSETFSNPFTCDALGRYEFFVSSSEVSYTITVTLGPVSYSWVYYTPDNTAAAGLIYEETWSDLVGRSADIDGAAAEVINDAGTHLDATDTGYDGGEVANLGRYRWNADWGRWERLPDLAPVLFGQPYESPEALEAANVPGTISVVRVVVDGTVLDYTRSDDPADIQSADAQWWVRVPATDRGYPIPFASRAEAESATVPMIAERIFVYSAPVGSSQVFTLAYIQDDDATEPALTTADGRNWVPDGEVTPYHFGENTVPGSTDLTPAIKSAITYIQADLGSGVLRFYRGQHRITEALEITGNNVGLKGDGTGKSYILNANLGGDAIVVAPENPTSAATAALSGFSLEGITIWRNAADASGSGAGISLTKVTNARLVDFAILDHFVGVYDRGVRNMDVVRGRIFPTSLPETAGACCVDQGGITLDDMSYYKGFTRKYTQCLFSDQNFACDSLFIIRQSDYTMISEGYFAFSKCQIIGDPESADSALVGVKVYDTYFDKASISAPSGENGFVEVRDTAATGSSVSGWWFRDCTFGQSSWAVRIRSGVNAWKFGFIGCSFQFLQSYAIRDGANSTDLTVRSCELWRFALDAALSAGDKRGIVSSGGGSLKLTGNNISTNASNIVGVEGNSCARFSMVANDFSGLGTDYILSSVTERQISGNISDNDITDDITADAGTWSPVLAFGGASTGITYSTQRGEWSRSNGWVTFSLYIVLTSKGTATGNATISLPFNAETGINGVATCFPGALAASTSRTSYAAAVVAGDDSALIRYTTDAGSLGNLTDADFTNTTNMVIQGSYYIGT